MAVAIRTWLARLRRDSSGAAAIGFAFSAVIFLVLSIGIVEFGRALFVRNQLGYAADVATRAALVDTEITQAEMQAKVHAAFRENDAQLTITFTTETAGGQEFRVLSLSYPLTLLIPFLETETVTLALSRRI